MRGHAVDERGELAEPAQALRPRDGGVGGRGRRQDEQPGLTERPGLEAEARPLAERPAVCLLADERHHRGTELSGDPLEPLGAAREVGRPQVAGPGRRPWRRVGDADAQAEDLRLAIGSEQLGREAGRLEQAPEVVARVREVSGGCRGDAPGVDPDEDQPEVGREQVGDS